MTIVGPVWIWLQVDGGGTNLENLWLVFLLGTGLGSQQGTP